MNIFNQSGNGLCIFKHPLHQNIDPKSDLTTEQKNELDPMFKSIMDELDLEKDKNAAVSFEAGKLKDLLLSPVQQRRLTGIVAKHDSEWKKTRTADFSQTCGVYRENGKEEIAKRIEKRIADLSIKLEVDGFNSDKQAYYLHPLGMIGWLKKYLIGQTLTLTEQDVIDIMKVTATEVVPSLKGNNFTDQLKGVVDTILNRSFLNSGDVRGVINKKWAFSDINTPRKSAYGAVQNVPMSRVSSRVKDGVIEHLKYRSMGGKSIVDGNLDYANPYYLDEASESTKRWVADVYEQARKSGQIFGAGKAIHVHGTVKGKQPAPEFRVILPESYN